MVKYTQEQIDTLNNLYTTEPILAVFSTKNGGLGLGDLVAALTAERIQTDDENKRYSFMMG